MREHDFKIISQTYRICWKIIPQPLSFGSDGDEFWKWLWKWCRWVLHRCWMVFWLILVWFVDRFLHWCFGWFWFCQGVAKYFEASYHILCRSSDSRTLFQDYSTAIPSHSRSKKSGTAERCVSMISRLFHRHIGFTPSSVWFAVAVSVDLHNAVFVVRESRLT